MKTPTASANIPAAVAYIQRHACEGLTLDRLVKETQCVSRYVFVRRFQAATGISPRMAILRCQLEEARRLLTTTELSLPFVAEHCGFRSLTQLDRALRVADGQDSTQLRRLPRPLARSAGTWLPVDLGKVSLEIPRSSRPGQSPP